MNHDAWADKRAVAFVDGLLTSFEGEQADRLELKTKAGKSLGGWGQAALLEQVRALLREAVYRGRTGRVAG